MKNKKNVFIHSKFKINNEISPIKIYEEMKINCEKNIRNNPFNSNTNSLFLEKRSSMVENLFNLAKKIQFKTLTVFKAINYFDSILNYYTPKDEKEYMIISLTCFIISSKFCENESLIPNIIFFIRNFSEIINNKYYFSINDIRLCEVKCLKMLKYNLNIFTKYDFLYFYFTQGIVYYEKTKNFIDKLEMIYLKTRDLIEKIAIYSIEIEYYNKSYLVIKYILKNLIEKNFNRKQSYFFLNKYNKDDIIDNKIKKKLDSLLNIKRSEKKNIPNVVFTKQNNNNNKKLKRILSDQNLFEESKIQERKELAFNSIKFSNYLKNSLSHKYKITIEHNNFNKLMKKKLTYNKNYNSSQPKISNSNIVNNKYLLNNSINKRSDSEKIISSHLSKFNEFQLNKLQHKYNSTLENNYSNNYISTIRYDKNNVFYKSNNTQSTMIYSSNQKNNYHCDLLKKTIYLLNIHSPLNNNNIKEYKIENYNKIPSFKNVTERKYSFNYNSIHSDSRSYLNFNYNCPK